MSTKDTSFHLSVVVAELHLYVVQEVLAEGAHGVGARRGHEHPLYGQHGHLARFSAQYLYVLMFLCLGVLKIINADYELYLSYTLQITIFSKISL